MTDIDIDKLETLRAAATPGEWREVEGEIWGEEPFAKYEVVAPTTDDSCEFRRGNAAWLTAIHNAAPALLAEVRRLRAIEAAARKLTESESLGLWGSACVTVAEMQALKAALAAKGTP